jgi:uncharacterized membrane protein YhhN
MTSLSWIALALAVVMAVVDWVAVARRSAVLEYLSKPTATIALIVVALTLDVAHDASWAWRVAAVVFCLLGDVFLMLPRDAFVPGLASFAVAQVLFTISFITAGIDMVRLVLAAVVAVPVGVVLARRFVGAIRRRGRPELVAPVVVYIGVISAMAIAAVAAGPIVAVIGAVLFMVSDAVIAESRFVRQRPWHGVGIMVTYHLALAGLVLGLL